MIVSVVLEKPLGEQVEGSVIQVDEEVAQALISAGVAREATADDMGGADEVEGEVTESDDGACMVQDQVRRLAADATQTVEKAVEQAVEKLTSTVKRPNLKAHTVPQNRHVTGSDEARTGGFKSLGDAFFCWSRKAKGDYDMARKWSRWEGISTKANMSITGGSGHQGGDLVPIEWAQQLWKLSFDKVPDLIGMCSQYPMQNQTLNIPLWVQSAADAGLQANVISEGSSITESVGVTATAQLALKKFTVLVNTTDELERFNSYALDAVIRNVAPQRIRYLSNDSFVNGSNGQVNLVGNSAAVVVPRATANRINYNDILKMEAALFDDFAEDAVWLTNQSTIPEIYSLSFPSRTATNPFPAFTPGAYGKDTLLGPRPVGELLGKPIYRLENVPGLGSTGDLILYSPRSIAAGQSGLAADKTPYLYFNLAQDTYRFLWYSSSVSLLNVPYERKDGSFASNIVVLKDLTS